MQPLSTLLEPIPFEALYNYLFYREVDGVLVPYLLEDFVSNLDSWLGSIHKETYSNRSYQKAIEVFVGYAEHITIDEHSVNIPFIQEIDVLLVKL